MIEVKSYTEKTLLEEVVLTERHLNDYLAVLRGDPNTIGKCAIAMANGGGKCSTDEAATFCLDCLTKHALTISGLASEGVRYIPEQREVYAIIKAIADEMFKDLSCFNKGKAEMYINALRNPRKKMVAKYLITGRLAGVCYGNECNNGHKHLK